MLRAGLVPIGLLVGVSCIFGACGGSDGPVDGWGIVKVEISDDAAPLEQLCIGGVCKGFDPADEVRSAEFSAMVSTGATYEIFLDGDLVDGAPSSSGGTRPGACTMVKLSKATGAQIFDGCEES